MKPVTYCPTCRAFALGAPCRRHRPVYSFATLGTAIAWVQDWKEVVAA